MPLLVAESVGLSAWSLATTSARRSCGISEAYYLKQMINFTGVRDINMALTKGFVFAVLIVFISCHQGLNAKEGAVGVGRAPTEAVVIGSLAILDREFLPLLRAEHFLPGGV